jgi:vitamin B12 transporter
MRRLAASGLLALVSAAEAHAQSGPVRTAPETLVTATRLETPIDQAGQAATVITGEEIERRQHRTVVDVLREVPGLSVTQSGGIGNQTSVFVRGANSNHTLVLIDGMRVNDPSTPSGIFNFAHLTTAEVDRIEVVLGPLSTLYGTDAIGGVINIITRKGRGRPSVDAGAEAGSFNTYAGRVATQGAQGRFNWNVGAAYLETDSVSNTPKRLRGNRGDESDPYENTTLSARLGADLSDNLEVSYVTRYVRSFKKYDSFLGEDPNLRENTSLWFNRAEGRLDLLDGRWTQRYGAGYVKIDRTDADDPDDFSSSFSRNTSEGTRTKFDWQNDIQAAEWLTLTAGLDTEKEEFESRGLGFTTAADARTNGAFAQARTAFWERLFLTLGGRVDDHDRFGDFETWRAAAAYHVKETGTRLRGSYGIGFKAPTLFQLFGRTTFSTGNPNLQPEESRGWDVGIDQTLADGRVTVGTGYFQTDIRNLIDSDPTFTTFVNVGRAEQRGIESYIAVRPWADFSVRLDHTYVSAENAITNTQLLRRPRHKLSVNADWTVTPAWNIAAGVIYNGQRADVDAITFDRIYPGGYTLVRVTTRYALNETWTVFGRVENLLDKRYEEPDGFNQPGIGAFAGVKATF